jgi:hypothetical protein
LLFIIVSSVFMLFSHQHLYAQAKLSWADRLIKISVYNQTHITPVNMNCAKPTIYDGIDYTMNANILLLAYNNRAFYSWRRVLSEIENNARACNALRLLEESSFLFKQEQIVPEKTIVRVSWSEKIISISNYYKNIGNKISLDKHKPTVVEGKNYTQYVLTLKMAYKDQSNLLWENVLADVQNNGDKAAEALNYLQKKANLFEDKNSMRLSWPEQFIYLADYLKKYGNNIGITTRHETIIDGLNYSHMAAHVIGSYRNNKGILPWNVVMDKISGNKKAIEAADYLALTGFLKLNIPCESYMKNFRLAFIL